ncbi:hypothetical protein [Parendozoicomonas haliclonae]|uniref:Uncharacterized protein n=1 Tax=Parendozoicomonas haliclonae TaxID=1960125 RepID=A0A1X7AM99_9GAMM|nr:hypothetical protein [Parendozoicomonas haliclonae]SMA48977.1 hypothetical protein EHSB41UT_02975 [Parendozoicomonas haliclonae]
MRNKTLIGLTAAIILAATAFGVQADTRLVDNSNHSSALSTDLDEDFEFDYVGKPFNMQCAYQIKLSSEDDSILTQTINVTNISPASLVFPVAITSICDECGDTITTMYDFILEADEPDEIINLQSYHDENYANIFGMDYIPKPYFKVLVECDEDELVTEPEAIVESPDAPDAPETDSKSSAPEVATQKESSDVIFREASTL